MSTKKFCICSKCGKKMHDMYRTDNELVFCGNCGQDELENFLAAIGNESNKFMPGNKKYYVIFDRLAMVEIEAKDEEEAWEIANVILENEDLDWTESAIKTIEEDEE